MKKFEDIEIGEKAYFSKTLSETDLHLFCGISGDFNPLHVDKMYSSKSLFKERVVHGLLVASLISNVLGMRLPGPGTVYVSQNLKFRAPAYVGDTITVMIEILEKIPEKKHLIVKTTCMNQEERIVIDGEAEVLFDPDQNGIQR